MPSLLDLPEEVLVIIGGYLDTTALGNLVSLNVRLLSSAARCTECLRVTSITPSLRNLLSRTGAFVRSLDVSDCFSDSTAIQKMIFMCPAIRELNIVNCSLRFSQIRLILFSSIELDTLSFTFVREKVPGSRFQGPSLRSPIRQLYVESDNGHKSVSSLAEFLRQCLKLERLHIHFVGNSPQHHMPDGPSSRYLLGLPLKTVMISPGSITGGCVLPFLYTNFNLLLRDSELERCKQMNVCLLTFEAGKCISSGSELFQSEENDVLRSAYHVRFNSTVPELMSFPWGQPRGLKIACQSAIAAECAASFFLPPITWSSDLVELDLIECLVELPGAAEWSDLIQSSPALEALTIPAHFLPPQAESLEDWSRPKRQRLRASFLSFLSTIRLKRLAITDSGTPRDFSGIDKLAHLEELSVECYEPSESMLLSLVNHNVRMVRLCFGEIREVPGLEKFIQRSIKLRDFKLLTTALLLDSDLLWGALARGELLEQICIESQSRRRVNLQAIENYLPDVIKKVKVLHVHADRANNRIQVRSVIQDLVRDSLRGHSQCEVHFESVLTTPLTSRKVEAPPICFPGRYLCTMAIHTAKIKLIR